MKRVAVMQPYFFPYAGYFRLFAAVDEFVIFDCVQFPRRGRVHRTEVRRQSGATAWLTLPLARHPRETTIVDLRFADNARTIFDERLGAFGWIRSASGPHADRVRALLFAPLHSPIDYLDAGLRLVANLLGFNPLIRRSSTMNLRKELRGQERILAAVKQMGGTHYLNAPGGRELYDREVFARHGVALGFLDPYEGRFHHLLPALLTGEASDIRADVLATSRLSW